MSFTRAKVKDFYLLATDVENIFINEYMPAAPGDYVKIYLYGLLYAQTGAEMDDRTFAQQLRLTEETVQEGWKYWEQMGVIRRIPGGTVEYLNLRAMMYGSAEKESESEEIQKAADRLCDTSVRDFIRQLEMQTGRLFDAQKEIPEILAWEEDYRASKEVILAAFSYCYERGKTGLSYIRKVVEAWAQEGLATTEEIHAYLEETGLRRSWYKRVLQSLGMNRGPTEAEKRMMDVWFDEMHYSIERVTEACDRTLSAANPNLRYVNKVLENWYQEAQARGTDVNQKVTVTQAVLNKYYEFLRHEAETKAQEHEREVYQKLPRVAEIDEKTRELGSQLARGLLTGMKSPQREEIRQKMSSLEEERAVLLTENNYPVDYTDIKYACEKCSDTGVCEDGNRCSCVRQRTGEAEVWQKREKETS